MADSIEPQAIVDRQIDAFNRRDIETIMSLYTEDIEVYEFPSTLLYRGATALRDYFGACFEEPHLKAYRLTTMVVEPRQTVIAMLRIDRTFPEGAGWIGLAMIYEVRGGRIARAWSITGDKVLDRS